MKAGKRPSECEYCWNIEDLGPSYLSDRTLKSSEFWAAPEFERVSAMANSENINPTYVEVSFSNVCNFRCSYCSGNFSTRWTDDISRNGSYSTRNGEQTMDILPEENNPYIKAFWEWWPELVKNLKVFRITGGEPLLSPNTFRVLEELSRNPQPDLEIGINSNLGISDASFQKFLALAKDLTENKKIKMIRLFTSVEAWGERAEYIRNGLQFMRFQRNLETFLKEVPQGQAVIMATFNSLSLTSFTDLLLYVKGLKETYTLDPAKCPLFIDISYLRHPDHQSIQLLPASYQKKMNDICDYMELNKVTDKDPAGFYFFEVTKAQRILEWMKQPLDDEKLNEGRRHFFKFFSEHDQRRQTNFLKSFPEMTDFWDLCQQ